MVMVLSKLADHHPDGSQFQVDILLDAMNGVFIAWVNQEPSEHLCEVQMLSGQETLFKRF